MAGRFGGSIGQKYCDVTFKLAVPQVSGPRRLSNPLLIWHVYCLLVERLLLAQVHDAELDRAAEAAVPSMQLAEIG